MKSLSTLCIIITFASSCFAGVREPVADYKSTQGLVASDTLYRWSIDINGDGKAEVFLSLKSTYEEDVHDEQMPSWHVYLADVGGATYTLSTGCDEGEGITPALPQIDVNLMYVGQIGQIHGYGLLTAEIEYPRKAEPVRYIYAYKVVGDHLKRTLLSKDNPKAPNPIFDQYLTEDKRSHVTLQQVRP